MLPPRFFSYMCALHCLYWLDVQRIPVTEFNVDKWLRALLDGATDDEICSIADALACMGYFD